MRIVERFCKTSIYKLTIKNIFYAFWYPAHHVPKTKNESKDRDGICKSVKVEPYGFLSKSPPVVPRVVFCQKTLTSFQIRPDERLSFFFFSGFFFFSFEVYGFEEN